MDNRPVDPASRESTPTPPDSTEVNEETEAPASFNQSSVSATEASGLLPAPRAEPNLFRRLSSYLLGLQGNPQSLTGRLLVGSGACYDELLLRTARSGGGCDLQACLSNLSDPAIIEQAIDIAIAHGHEHIVAELLHLTLRQISPEEYSRFLPHWLWENRELSERQLELTAKLIPCLPEAGVVEIFQRHPQCRKLPTLNKILASYDHGNLSPAVVVQSACQRQEQKIRESFALNEYIDDADVARNTFEFLVRQKNEALMPGLQQLTSSVNPEVIPVEFLATQASDTQLHWLFHTLRYTFCNSVHGRAHHKSYGKLFESLLERFPDNIDLKFIVLDCPYRDYQGSKRYRAMFEEVLRDCRDTGRLADMGTLLEKAEKLDRNLSSQIALEMLNGGVKHFFFYKNCLNYLPFETLESRAQDILSFLEKSKAKDPDGCFNAHLLNTYCLTLAMTNHERAAEIYSRVVELMLRRYDYESLHNFFEHSHILPPLPEPFPSPPDPVYHFLASHGMIPTAYSSNLIEQYANQPEALKAIWDIDPIVMAVALLDRIVPEEFDYGMIFYSDELTRRLSELKDKEALMAMLPERCLRVLRMSSDQSGIPLDRYDIHLDETLSADGAKARIFATAEAAAGLMKEDYARGISCLLLYVQKLYPVLCVTDGKESVKYPVHYTMDYPVQAFRHLFKVSMQTFLEKHRSRLDGNTGFLKAAQTVEHTVPDWLKYFRNCSKASRDWTFEQCFESINSFRQKDLSDPERLRLDWMSGYLECLRVQVCDDLTSRTLKTFLSRPPEEWPDTANLPGPVASRMENLRLWLKIKPKPE